jgi:hypothetical protein
MKTFQITCIISYVVIYSFIFILNLYYLYNNARHGILG